MRRRLLLLTAATTALVLAALLVPLGLLARSHAADRATADATARAQYVASGVGTALGGPDGNATAESFVEGADDPSRPRTSVLLADGHVLGAPAAVTDAVRLARTGRAFTYAPPDGGRRILVPVQGAGATAVVQVAVSESQLYEGVLASWLTFAGIGVGLVLLGLLIADRLGARLVGTTRSLAHVAERLSAGDLAARAEAGHGPAELRLIGAELNRLAARIEELLTAERENAADLAHRLRTPVAALRLDAEGLRDPAEAERLLGSVTILERGVDEVIRRSRRPLHAPARADLAAVTGERVAFWRPLAEDQGRTVRLSASDTPLPVPVPGDELAAVVDALIGNVLDHTPDGTAFRVTAGSTPDGPCLTVEDDGPGFASARSGGAPADPADRGHSGAGSTGLGLDIARRTAEQTGGRLTVDSGSAVGAPADDGGSGVAGGDPAGARVTLLFGDGQGRGPGGGDGTGAKARRPRHP